MSDNSVNEIESHVIDESQRGLQVHDVAYKSDFSLNGQDQPSSYKRLAMAIEKALQIKYEQTSEEMMKMVTESTPQFVWSQFMRSLVLHFLWLILNVLSLPLMLLFTNFTFVQNAGFFPTK